MAQNSRTGFRKRSDRSDWVVEGNRLVWTQSNRPSVEISETATLLDHWCDLAEMSTDKIPKIEKLELLSIIKKHPNPPLNEMYRIQVIATCRELDMKEYIRAGEVILSSTHWSDAEKIGFLAAKLPRLPGLKYGRDVQKLLYRVRWQDSRLKRPHDKILRVPPACILQSKSPIEDLDQNIEIDRSIVNDLKGDVILYRGFNVPVDLSVRGRNVKSWDRQDEGRGVYFSLSEKLALAFACLQKSSFAAKMTDGIQLDSNEQSILGGKLVVGKYRVPADKIVLYHHAIARLESECICKPGDVSLMHYEFYGFDEFNESLRSYAEIVTQFERGGDIETVRELALARNPKRKRARPS